MATIDERKIMELTSKSTVALTDQFVLEDEDGTKRGNVSELLKLLKVNLIFDTVEDLKSAAFKDGDKCMTLGYHAVGDGGAAMYKINYDPAAKEDGGNVLYLKTSDTLRAFFCYEGVVTPEQFGAWGDGSRNDAKAINTIIQSGYNIKFRREARYVLSEPIIPKSGTFIDFNGATLYPVNCDGIQYLDEPQYEKYLDDVTLLNFKMDMSKGLNPIKINNPTTNLRIEGFNIYDITSPSMNVITVGYCKNGFIGNGNMIVTDTSIAVTGVHVNAGVRNYYGTAGLKISNVNMDNLSKGVLYNMSSYQSQEAQYGIDINNCNFETSRSGAYLVQVAETKSNITIRNCQIKNASAARSSYSGIIKVEDMTCHNCREGLLHIINSETVVILDGFIRMHGDGTVPAEKIPVYTKMYGSLYNNATFILNEDRYTEKFKLAADFIGSVYDRTPVDYYPVEVVASPTVSLARNAVLDIAGNTDDIIDIANGVNNQIIKVFSSTGRKIVKNLKLNLKATKTLSASTYVVLKNISGVWHEI